MERPPILWRASNALVGISPPREVVRRHELGNPTLVPHPILSSFEHAAPRVPSKLLV
jgi:hypothetical protein